MKKKSTYMYVDLKKRVFQHFQLHDIGKVVMVVQNQEIQWC